MNYLAILRVQRTKVMVFVREQDAPMNTWIALLGRKDMPTDGIADYCAYLGQSLVNHGIDLRTVRVEWVERGWVRALRNLWRESKDWRGLWVIPQYTAMGWSNRGFPLGALACAAILRIRGARGAMLFHEPLGVGGPRLIDTIRRAFQDCTVRSLHHFAEKSIFTIPLNAVTWLPKRDAKSAFIPLGPNIPENLVKRNAVRRQNGAPKTVAVFCVSESPYGQREVEDIAAAMRISADGERNLRLVFVGRGTLEAKPAIECAFVDSPVEVCNLGLREASEVAQILSEADAMIAVRGRFNLRRGSALAGLACGLPIVGYAGATAGTILEEAGVTLVPFGDRQALGSALREILANPVLWQRMHEKNLYIQNTYLSWLVVATSFVEFLSGRPA